MRAWQASASASVRADRQTLDLAWGFEGSSFDDKRGRELGSSVRRFVTVQVDGSLMLSESSLGLILSLPARCVLPAGKGRRDFPRIRHSYNFIWRLKGLCAPGAFSKIDARDLSRFDNRRKIFKIENYPLSTLSAIEIRPTRIARMETNSLRYEDSERVLPSTVRKDTERNDSKELRKTMRLPRPRFLSLDRYRFIRHVPFRLPSFERGCTLAIHLSFLVPVYAGHNTHANSILFWNLADDNTTYSHRK